MIFRAGKEDAEITQRYFSAAKTLCLFLSAL